MFFYWIDLILFRVFRIILLFIILYILLLIALYFLFLSFFIFKGVNNRLIDLFLLKLIFGWKLALVSLIIVKINGPSVDFIFSWLSIIHKSIIQLSFTEPWTLLCQSSFLHLISPFSIYVPPILSISSGVLITILL
jgi:hypothetical protein